MDVCHYWELNGESFPWAFSASTIIMEPTLSMSSYEIQVVVAKVFMSF